MPEQEAGIAAGSRAKSEHGKEGRAQPTGVGPDVLLQVSRGLEGLAAQLLWALVWLLSSVGAHMTLQSISCPHVGGWVRRALSGAASSTISPSYCRGSPPYGVLCAAPGACVLPPHPCPGGWALECECERKPREPWLKGLDSEGE